MHLKFSQLVGVLLVGFYSLCAEERSEEILEYTYHRLPNCGVLRNTGERLYVELDAEYVDELVTFIRSEGFDEPEAVGSRACIEVITKGETSGLDGRRIDEDGEMIYFTAKRCLVVSSSFTEEACVIGVEAPELDRIREKYGLSRRDGEFYIKIGEKSLGFSY